MQSHGAVFCKPESTIRTECVAQRNVQEGKIMIDQNVFASIVNPMREVLRSASPQFRLDVLDKRAESTGIAHGMRICYESPCKGTIVPDEEHSHSHECTLNDTEGCGWLPQEVIHESLRSQGLDPKIRFCPEGECTKRVFRWIEVKRHESAHLQPKKRNYSCCDFTVDLKVKEGKSEKIKCVGHEVKWEDAKDHSGNDRVTDWDDLFIHDVPDPENGFDPYSTAHSRRRWTIVPTGVKIRSENAAKMSSEIGTRPSERQFHNPSSPRMPKQVFNK